MPSEKSSAAATNAEKRGYAGFWTDEVGQQFCERENLRRVDVVSTGDYWNEFGEDTTYQLHFWPDEKNDEFNYTKSKHNVGNEAVMKEQSTRN